MNGKALAAVVVIAGLAGAATFYVFPNGAGVTETPGATSDANSSVTTDGTDAAALAQAQSAASETPAAKLVEVVPDFKLADRAGKMTSLRDWHGKSLIVNFWATWCAPCRREIPLLEQMQRERSADGFQVVGIAVDFRDKVLEYADQMKIQYPLLIGEQDALDAASAFGVDAVGFPFTVFSDAQGRVIVAHMGELTAAGAALILDTVAKVNAGQLTPAAARQQIEAGMPALPQEKDAKSAG